MVPNAMTILSPITASTLSSRCRLGSCLPTCRVRSCSAVIVDSSWTDLLYASARVQQHLFLELVLAVVNGN
ncbi:hypothetical protein BC936DRAFT_147430 [Jimgerdemannia flammicorona]|uniref:Uncharacterized protein n=2 Tax=Jimgerdemannia flammicorona TaxID=994334 RepID=A0A433D5A9_9FUNG|nr:hypothetical protein BC936DRAFT_147430 [Jimgerdemannia flammicorona]RUS29741.1 hypothetical protein BC938DRAFT_480299 [Jimgerdemannia flammicorona]